MRTYLSGAIAYIEESGDELERARLAGLLGRPQPEPRIARTLAVRQNEDGGYPYGMIPGRPSAIGATVAGLQWLHDLRLTTGGIVERAVGYLLSVQRPEGTWDETPAVMKFDPPRALRPGLLGGRLHSTALVAFWLARVIGPGHDTVARACKALRAQRWSEWPVDEPVGTTVLITAVGALVEGPTGPMASGGLGVLSGRAADVWTGETMADLLSAVAVTRIAPDQPLVTGAIARLRAAQRPDGGWTSDQSRDRDVDLSLRALGALLALGVSTA